MGLKICSPSKLGTLQGESGDPLLAERILLFFDQPGLASLEVYIFHLQGRVNQTGSFSTVVDKVDSILLFQKKAGQQDGTGGNRSIPVPIDQ